MKKRILFICPTLGNGGIQSWTRKMLQTYSNEEYQLVHVDVAYRRSVLKHEKGIRRRIDGITDLIDVYRDAKKAIKSNSISLMHTTTSGNIGTLRDYILVKLCHRYNIPCIMHCRYGCISEDFTQKGFWGNLLRKTMHLYDNVWVLDNRSLKTLEQDPLMKGKVFLTPNSIVVPESCDLSPKKYTNVAFVGNLVPSKGLFELINAVLCLKGGVNLTIAGPGNEVVIAKIKEVAGNAYGDYINYVGKLPNPEAVKLIKSMDMVALPTYYKSEAFPISIIESMSYGKMVIASKRAAIQDMLTDIDGNECGYFVREQSTEDIVEAIKWCQNNPEQADKRCAKAYEKVKTCYSTDVIYNLYRTLYKKLI